MPAKRGAAVIKKEEEKDDDAGSKVVDVAHASSPTAESPKGTPQRLVEESPAVSGKRKVSSHNHPRCPARLCLCCLRLFPSEPRGNGGRRRPEHGGRDCALAVLAG